MSRFCILQDMDTKKEKRQFPSACPLCGCFEGEFFVQAPKDWEYGIPYSGDLVQCVNCNLVRMYPLPTIEELGAFYPSDYANYSYPQGRLYQFLLQLYQRSDRTEIEGLVGKTGRILDIGCSDGSYLDSLRGKGEWELCGTEFSDSAAIKAKDKGYCVFVGELETLSLPNEHFRLIRLNHVIEHVLNPVSTMKEVWRVLEIDGCVVLETPNINCPDFILLKRFWGALHYPRHLHLFSTDCLSKMAQKAGFVLERVEYSLMPSGWALGIQNFLCSRCSISKQNGRMPFYSFFLLLFIPILFIQRVFKRTTMVRMTLRKTIADPVALPKGR